MNKVFKLERRLVKYVRPIAKRVVDIPLPDDDYFQAIEDLFVKLRGVDQILVDPEVTTVRLVTNPEKVVLKETQRAFMYFCLYKMSIDAIVMNRMLPDNIKDDYFKGWIQGQQYHLGEAKEFFSPVPIFPVDLFTGEVIGYNDLKQLADQIYKDANPLERFLKDEPYRLVKQNKDYKLILKLPFISKKDVVLNKLHEELIIRIGGFKRHIMLPRQVASLNAVKAKLEGEYLNVTFKGDENDGEKEYRANGSLSGRQIFHGSGRCHGEKIKVL
jgi:arsenite-transporting ATPase